MNLALSELARVFNKNAFEDLLQGDFSLARNLDKVFFQGTNKTIGEFYENSYKFLSKNYKNEYIFKNTIAKKIVIGRHKLSDITFFDEFKVWDNYVDTLVVNGCITAYEIKTEYDSYNRLAHQLETYCQVFEYVNLVVPEVKYTNVLIDSLPETIGILVLSERNTLSERRKPKSNLLMLSQEMIFSCLWKSEYENFVRQKSGGLPDVKPVYMRSECLNFFKASEIIDVNVFFHNVLKKRKSLEMHKQVIASIPKSLSGIFLVNEINTVEKIIKLANTELY